MEATIANRWDNSFNATESKKDRADFRKHAKFSTSSSQEMMTISRVRPVRILGGPNLEEKRGTPFKDTKRRHLTLKEL